MQPREVTTRTCWGMLKKEGCPSHFLAILDHHRAETLSGTSAYTPGMPAPLCIPSGCWPQAGSTDPGAVKEGGT